MTTITAETDRRALTLFLNREAAAVVAGARTAVERQTEQTKREARAVVNAGLTGSRVTRGGSRRVANTIRSETYPRTPAGFVFSTWGYFEGGRFVDILATHEQGRTIVPRRRRMLFIPFVGGQRRRNIQRRGLPGERLDLIPLGDSLLVVTRARGNRQGLVLGILVRRVRIPKRLDFGAVEQRALEELQDKTIVDIERASRRLTTSRLAA